MNISMTLFQISETGRRFLMVVSYYTRFLGKLVVRSNQYDSYVSYANHMGDNTEIIFDGYLANNTKYHCHRKRNPIQSNEINFSLNMLLDCWKDLFLSNSSDK